MTLTILVILAICLILGFIRYRIHLLAWYIGFPLPKNRITVQKNVMVSMPDGIRLATDIYRPKLKGKYPVIVARTPYNKSGKMHPYKRLASLFACQGYIVVIQDVRGKYQSEGEFFPYASEAVDGHQTVTWAGEAEWSNGKVALMGISYLGSCAWLAAKYPSPYLRTIIPMFTSHDTYSIWIDHGIPFLKGPLWWLAKFSGKKEEKITPGYLQKNLWKLPFNELDVAMVDHRIPFFREYLTHMSPDPFWDNLSLNKFVKDIDIPILIVGGWYDPFLIGTFGDYERFTATTKQHHCKLFVGPWSHNPAQKFSELSFGEKADASIILGMSLQWCDKILKEEKYLEADKVHYFVMGENDWRDSEKWPPANVTYEKYFLSVKESGIYRKNGLLSTTPSSQLQATLYGYNPHDPAFFRGRSLVETEEWIASLEQVEIMTRSDVLIYTSGILEEDLVIAGRPKLVLYISTDAFDTDFCAKISDVYPNGKIYSLAPGFIRMRYRESLSHPQLLVPGTIYRVEIDFRPLAASFLKGHRIQLQITSSDFPVHTRNLNTGLSCEYSTEIKQAEQTIYAGGSCDSHLILPVLRDT